MSRKIVHRARIAIAALAIITAVWLLLPKHQILQLEDLTMKIGSGRGGRFVELTNSSINLIMVPNDPGFFLSEINPSIDKGDNKALISLGDVCILRPGSTLRLPLWDDKEPKFVSLDAGSYDPSLRKQALTDLVHVWTIASTKLN